jgi:hypothetical protein
MLPTSAPTHKSACTPEFSGLNISDASQKGSGTINPKQSNKNGQPQDSG